MLLQDILTVSANCRTFSQGNFMVYTYERVFIMANTKVWIAVSLILVSAWSGTIDASERGGGVYSKSWRAQEKTGDGAKPAGGVRKSNPRNTTHFPAKPSQPLLTSHDARMAALTQSLEDSEKKYKAGLATLNAEIEDLREEQKAINDRRIEVEEHIDALVSATDGLTAHLGRHQARLEKHDTELKTLLAFMKEREERDASAAQSLGEIVSKEAMDKGLQQVVAYTTAVVARRMQELLAQHTQASSEGVNEALRALEERTNSRLEAQHERLESLQRQINHMLYGPRYQSTPVTYQPVHYLQIPSNQHLYSQPAQQSLQGPSASSHNSQASSDE
jgi:hypothetical protein